MPNDLGDKEDHHHAQGEEYEGAGCPDQQDIPPGAKEDDTDARQEYGRYADDGDEVADARDQHMGATRAVGCG